MITFGLHFFARPIPLADFSAEALADHLRPQMSKDNLDRLEAAVQDSAEDA